MPEHERPFTLVFRAPVSIFTGLGIAGLIDRTVVRDSSGLPYIPGSSVKGRLRFFAERLASSSSPPHGYWLHAQSQPSCKQVDKACAMCRLFGNPSIAALLRVGNASPASPWHDLFQQLLEANANPVVYPDVEIRPGIAVSRVRRTALPDHLFFDEAIPAVSFSGNLVLDARVTAHEVQFLIGAGKLVDALGARKATGRGALEGGICIAEPAR